ncbi:MAG: 1,4-dihydroxy-6-naphthoate synthase [Leptospira sp.]|nr:1,4-dihydroxy-6-naphthoate synthase [Leptospira sp.]
MSKPNFTIAYSPCPNDTFLFYHLTHSEISSDFKVQEELKDVEELNQSAAVGKYDITKLSFAAYFQVSDKYDLLSAGSALGRNCGPLLIYPQENFSAEEEVPKNISEFKNILSPGEHTTANLLLKLFAHSQVIPLESRKDPSAVGKISPLPISYHRYDRIIPELKKGAGDLGLVIHEERFTYEAQGMKKWMDLGEWWEETTGTPIPLGCIAIRKTLSSEWKEKINQSIQKSLEMAWENPKIPQEYILENSQNKDLEVVRSHIDLYVNRFTHDLGEEGRNAIRELQSRFNAL